jgi:hypothetical protein
MIYKLSLENGQNVFAMRFTRPTSPAKRLLRIYPEGQLYLKRSDNICMGIYAPGLFSGSMADAG